MIGDQRRLWDTFATREIFENENRKTLPVQSMCFHLHSYGSIISSLAPRWDGATLASNRGQRGEGEEESSLVISKHLWNPARKTSNLMSIEGKISQRALKLKEKGAQDRPRPEKSRWASRRRWGLCRVLRETNTWGLREGGRDMEWNRNSLLGKVFKTQCYCEIGPLRLSYQKREANNDSCKMNLWGDLLCAKNNKISKSI